MVQATSRLGAILCLGATCFAKTRFLVDLFVWCQHLRRPAPRGLYSAWRQSLAVPRGTKGDAVSSVRGLCIATGLLWHTVACMCCDGVSNGIFCHCRAEGLLGDVLAAGGCGAPAAGDAVADLGFAVLALGVAGEEACQAALASRGASALLCRLLQAR